MPLVAAEAAEKVQRADGPAEPRKCEESHGKFYVRKVFFSLSRSLLLFSEKHFRPLNRSELEVIGQ